MPTIDRSLTIIGHVRSTLTLRSDAPCQGDEGAPAAVIEIAEGFAAGLSGIAAGDELVLLTWLHEARRDVLELHPRGDVKRPRAGVFTTRSPDRPNPIGLHRVRVTGVAERALHVEALEAIDGTPVIDIKPVLGDVEGR